MFLEFGIQQQAVNFAEISHKGSLGSKSTDQKYEPKSRLQKLEETRGKAIALLLKRHEDTSVGVYQLIRIEINRGNPYT
jgi:hypothetical protein